MKKREIVFWTHQRYSIYTSFIFLQSEKPRKQSQPLSKKSSQLQFLVGSKSQDLSPISLKHNKVSFPNTATSGIKYALVLAEKIAFWTSTISACPLSNLKNVSLIWITFLLTSPRCLSWMCPLVSFLPSPCTASFQALSVNAFRWRTRDERPGDA